MRKAIFFATLLCSLFTGYVSGQPGMTLEDRVYDDRIHTVLCYSMRGTDLKMMPPSVAGLDQQDLVLEFDDLQDQRQNYYVRLLHCNYDWSRSTLMDLDIMSDYNEFNITDYTPSISQETPYIHYRFAIPPVKVPGNYVVMVYRDGNRQDVVLTHRLMIVQPVLDVATDQDLAGLGNMRTTRQPLSFIVQYGRTEIINPAASVHVVIRQNQRWDNAQVDVKPSFIREDQTQLEYRVFDVDKAFWGGNEFRFVDFRSLRFPGQNTGRVETRTKPWTLWVVPDAPRADQAYAQYNDMNGSYLIDNQDYRQEPWISAQYVQVQFSLKSPRLDKDVYVMGAFNRWQKTNENKMRYNNGLYESELLLKQGFYNYLYTIDGSGSSSLEGDHYQTENFYEVLVYYRPFQPNADLLLGYFTLNVNAR